MAKNKITHEWNEDGTAIIFTGCGLKLKEVL